MSFQSRRVKQLLWIWITCILVASTALIHVVAGPVDISKLPPALSRSVDFAKDVQPILEKSCLKCHNTEKAKGKLILDTREHALKGGDIGPDIVVGDSAKSPLIHFTARLVEDSEMPPIGKGEALSKEQVGILRAWIDQGAKWPEEVVLRESGEGTELSGAVGTPRPTSEVSLPPAANRKVDFVKDIQPIFSSRCYECHAEKKQEAQFRLDAKEIALKGGELGPAIVPGKSDESLLIRAVAGVKPDFVMPKKGERLTAEQIGLLRAWIDQGAEWPDSASVKLEDKRNHWAFKPPVRPPVPIVKQKKMGAKSDRQLCVGTPGTGTFEAIARSGSRYSDSAPQPGER